MQFVLGECPAEALSPLQTACRIYSLSSFKRQRLKDRMVGNPQFAGGGGDEGTARRERRQTRHGNSSTSGAWHAAEELTFTWVKPQALGAVGAGFRLSEGVLRATSVRTNDCGAAEHQESDHAAKPT